MNRVLITLGVLTLIAAWAGSLPALVPGSFTAHMALHMVVVGIGAPLVAVGLAPRAATLIGRRSTWGLPVAASLLDLIVIWGWHTPVLHAASRNSALVLVVEQASFAAVALLVWLVAFAAPEGRRNEAALSGAMTLFFTSMHMTLLGALIGLAPRMVFHQHGDHVGALADQHLGAAIMLAIGGVIYLGGALVLVARVLRRPVTP